MFLEPTAFGPWHTAQAGKTASARWGCKRRWAWAAITPHGNGCTSCADATPLAHRVASLLKRWWLGTHQGAIRPDHLAYYLDEFTFRFNRRTSRSRGKLFYRLIEGALQTDPVPAKTLTQHLEGRESTA